MAIRAEHFAWTPILLLAFLVVPSMTQPTREALADNDVTAAIENELLVDDSVPFHPIDVTTMDGIVTLAGSVQSLFERQRVTEIAMAVKGVRSVVNLVEVVPVLRTDARIRSDVEDALRLDPVADEYELAVQVDAGLVTLTGETDSWAEKEIALDVARRVRGVTAVEDDIEVDIARDRPDAEIAAEISRRLVIDVRVDARRVDVSVVDGRVTLAGTVGSAEERTRAYRDAWISGVSVVDAEKLEVELWAQDKALRNTEPMVTYPMTDAEIAEAVVDAFRYDPRVRSWNPGVTVKTGTVTLTGQVSNLLARRAAEDDARNTIGVLRVRNHIKVRPTHVPNDSELAERVRRALRRNPYLDSSRIDVRVVDGVVYLSNTLDSRWKRSQAEAVAAGIEGPVEVVNNIGVKVPVWKSDWEIAEDVRFELYWNPVVNPSGIEIEVQDGVVTLTGTVESWQERNVATDEAFEGGAVSVRNRLALTS